ncbi:tripartite tricarboxylate transporter substrate binding protein, partial [Bordetella holmesii]|nr:tripartite tricarboxylate transporter substrate binding protein [Bordetella holmesii]
MPHSLLTQRALLLAPLLTSLGSPAFAAEQTWPQPPIRMVVAGSPGAGGDLFARLISTPRAHALK